MQNSVGSVLEMGCMLGYFIFWWVRFSLLDVIPADGPVVAEVDGAGAWRGLTIEG
jgi:hypothetical protein